MSGYRASVTINMSGISRQTTRAWTSRGRTSAVRPRIRPMLARLEPITFPMARFGFPPIAATVHTTNSGADVPNETIVSPTTIGLTPSDAASRAEPLTSHSAP